MDGFTRTGALIKLRPFKKWQKRGQDPLFVLGGQAAVQYILMVGIVSLAVVGVVQARFNAFKTTMQSVKQEMAQVIGGSRRMPARWYAKEMEDYSAAVASLQTQRGDRLPSAEAGEDMAGEAARGRGGKGTGEAGEEDTAGGEAFDARGYGKGFYGGAEDGGFGDSSGSFAGDDAGGLSGRSGKKDKSSKTAFGGDEDFGGGVEYAEDEGQYLADSKRAKAVRGESQSEDAAAPKKAEERVDDDTSKDGSIKKAIGGDEEEKKGGKMKLDWATIIKLVLIIAIIIILIILLLGSVAGGKSEE